MDRLEVLQGNNQQRSDDLPDIRGRNAGSWCAAGDLCEPGPGCRPGNAIQIVGREVMGTVANCELFSVSHLLWLTPVTFAVRQAGSGAGGAIDGTGGAWQSWTGNRVARRIADYACGAPPGRGQLTQGDCFSRKAKFFASREGVCPVFGASLRSLRASCARSPTREWPKGQVWSVKVKSRLHRRRQNRRAGVGPCGVRQLYVPAAIFYPHWRSRCSALAALSFPCAAAS